MTDKEKKELKEGVISIFKSFNILDHTATIGGLRNDILACINSMQEEPASEDLKKAADNALESISDQYDFISIGSCLEMFRLGAEWQKAQEYTCYEEAFEDGAKWKKEQMMANAADVTITGIREYKEENEVDFTLMLEKGTIPYKLEEDIKVIIIKEN